MKKVFLLFWLIPTLLQGAHLSPWTETDLEIIAQADLAYAHFKAGPSRNALFFDLSGRTSYNSFAGELEASFAHTHSQRGLGGDALALTARYQLKSDVIGDPFSLWVGLTARKVFTNGLHDVACLYHGGVEGELHAAIGKEWSCEQFWIHRLWGFALVGDADLGWPWLRLGAVWEKNWWDLNRLSVEISGENGFGHRRWHPRHFKGYGPIRYSYLQLAGKYAHAFEFGGIAELGLEWRPFTRNCPRHWCAARLSLIYPFGL